MYRSYGVSSKFYMEIEWFWTGVTFFDGASPDEHKPV